jgi:hypothetical protein
LPSRALRGLRGFAVFVCTLSPPDQVHGHAVHGLHVNPNQLLHFRVLLRPDGGVRIFLRTCTHPLAKYPSLAYLLVHTTGTPTTLARPLAHIYHWHMHWRMHSHILARVLTNPSVKSIPLEHAYWLAILLHTMAHIPAHALTYTGTPPATSGGLFFLTS